MKRGDIARDEGGKEERKKEEKGKEWCVWCRVREIVRKGRVRELMRVRGREEGVWA